MSQFKLLPSILMLGAICALAGCVSELPPEQMKTTLTGKTLNVELPPDRAATGGSVTFSRPTVMVGGAGANAAVNGLVYGHPELAPQADEEIHLPHSLDYSVAAAMKAKFGAAEADDLSYKLSFNELAFLRDNKDAAPGADTSIWYHINMAVADPTGTRISQASCEGTSEEHYPRAKWFADPAVGQAAAAKIVSLCIAKFSHALGY